MILKYKIENEDFSFDSSEENIFEFGEDTILSSNESDATYSQKWYNEGCTIEEFLNTVDFEILKKGIEVSLIKIINEELKIYPHEFKLEEYHKVVTDEKSHYKVVSRTRDLFPPDFNFNIQELIFKFRNILGLDLTDISPQDGKKIHIIVRINRPRSNDFNPPHKDIYEGLDDDKIISKFINFWIPICGVNINSSLPVVKGSHLIPESKILRTFKGGKIQGNEYRVRMIKEWEGNNTLRRTKIIPGEILIFSSHLIHGLAINNNEDLTRVALEFRLFSE